MTKTLKGNGTNILGRNIVSLYKDYKIKSFENYNIIIINENDDLIKGNDIEYINCVFHFITLKPLENFNFDYNIIDTVSLNFIDLSKTNQADLILTDIINFSLKEKNFSFLDYKIFSNFIIHNIPNSIEMDQYNNTFQLGSTIYIPKKLYIYNNTKHKFKIDLYPFSNNYNVIGLNIETNFNEFILFLDKNIVSLNTNIEKTLI